MDPKQLKAFIQSAYKLSPNQAARAFAKEREKSSADLKRGPVPEVRTRAQPQQTGVYQGGAFVKDPAPPTLETGPNGGQFYRTEYGTKIYVPKK